MRKFSQLSCLSVLVTASTLFACSARMEGDDAEPVGQLEQNLDSHSWYLACSDTTCVTRLRPLPNDVEDSLTWDPCAGKPFTWSATIDFEPNYDSLTIGGVSYDGWNTSISGSATGAVDVHVRTDYSVASGGFRDLAAVCPAAPPAPIYLETECAIDMGGAYQLPKSSRPGFSGTGYQLSAANTLTTSGVHDSASYTFESASARYWFYFRVNTNANANDDSWFYRIDGGSWVTMNDTSSLGSGWVWAKATTALNLSNGAHTFDIMSRENGLMIDKIALIPSGSAAPSGVGAAAHNCPLVIPPHEVSCDELTCDGNDICCTREELGVSYCTDQLCLADSNGGAVTIHACDSQDDCGAGSVCVHAFDGNLGSGGFICMSEANASAHPYASNLCLSPVGSWPDICPTGEVCGTTDRLGYAHCVAAPEVSCGDLTCSGGEACCGGFSTPEHSKEPRCADLPQTCFTLNNGTPSQCDHQADCGGAVCAIVGTGNQGLITGCYTESEFAQYEAEGRYAQRLCSSPAGSTPCPSGQVCGEANLIGYSYCQAE